MASSEAFSRHSMCSLEVVAASRYLRMLGELKHTFVGKESAFHSLLTMQFKSLQVFNYRRVKCFFFSLAFTKWGETQSALSLLASSNQLCCFSGTLRHQALLPLVFFLLGLFYDRKSSTAWPDSLLTCCNQFYFISVSSCAPYAVWIVSLKNGGSECWFCRRLQLTFCALRECPTKGQEDSSCWREIKGRCAEPDGRASCKQRQSLPCDGAGLRRAAAQRRSAPFLCLLSVASPYPELRRTSCVTTEHLQWDTTEMASWPHI